MPKLNDTQLILLSSASQHPDGSFYPLPAALADTADGATKAIATLAKRGYAEERETGEPASVHRTDGDLRYGMFITDAGIKAINARPEDANRATTPTAPKSERQSKASAVVALLQRHDGATLAELIDATGWLPHTTRAALTGLRKKGHAIERSKRGDCTCYRIVKAA